jgi:hypothetical protein
VVIRNRWRVLALAAALSLALAACGGGDGDDGVATLGGDGGSEASASPSVDPEDALAEFAECVRDNGIEDFEDPTVNEDGGIEIGFGGGGDPPSEAEQEEMQAAMEACGDLLPRGEGRGQISEEDQAAFEDALLGYARCMREQGIDMPDPEFSEGGGGGSFVRIGEGADPSDPDFQAADEECRPILEGVFPDDRPEQG